jgi:phage portal protein BeeE
VVFQLVAAAFGIPKTELGLVEDVNRNTSEAQLETIHKRVTQPLAETIGQAVSRQLFPQFNVFERLEQPFKVSLKFSDPRQERAREEHVRGRWESGLATYREVRNEIGEGEPDDETTVTINGETIDYGEHPKHVVESLLVDARGGDNEPEPDAEA